MARTVNLTEKLGLEEKPQIVIGDTTITVDNRAESVLRIFEIMQSRGDSVQGLIEALDILIDKSSAKDLKKLDLSFADYQIIAETAIDLAIGGDDTQGEEQTRDTTS